MRTVPFIEDLKKTIPGRSLRPFGDAPRPDAAPVLSVVYENITFSKPPTLIIVLLAGLMLFMGLNGEQGLPTQIFCFSVAAFCFYLIYAFSRIKKGMEKSPAVLDIYDDGIWLPHDRLFIPYSRLLTTYISAEQLKNNQRNTHLYLLVFDSPDNIARLKTQMKKTKSLTRRTHMQIVDKDTRMTTQIAAIFIAAFERGAFNVSEEDIVLTIRDCAAKALRRPN